MLPARVAAKVWRVNAWDCLRDKVCATDAAVCVEANDFAGLDFYLAVVPQSERQPRYRPVQNLGGGGVEVGIAVGIVAQLERIVAADEPQIVAVVQYRESERSE